MACPRTPRRTIALVIAALSVVTFTASHLRSAAQSPQSSPSSLKNTTSEKTSTHITETVDAALFAVRRVLDGGGASAPADGPAGPAGEAGATFSCPTPRAEVNAALLAREYLYHYHTPRYSSFSEAFRELKLRASRPLRNTTVATRKLPLFLIARQYYAMRSQSMRILLNMIDSGVRATPLISFVQGVYDSLSGSKATQVLTKRRLAFARGCSYDAARIQPATFVTFDDAECRLLRASMDAGRRFIVKPRVGEQGEGIRILAGNSEELRATYNDLCVARALPSDVVQEYIADPLLIEGSKFDLRAFMLIGSTSPYTVFFRPGFVRRSLARFDPASSNRAAHLTNSHIQTNVPGYQGAAHVWSMDQFRTYVEGPGGPAPSGWVQNTLVPHMERVTRMLFESARPWLRRRRGSFHLVGLDFMVDARLGVHFIEANSAPGLGYQSLWKGEFSRRLCLDMFVLVHSLQAKPATLAHIRVGDVARGFRLLYSERHERCVAAAVLGSRGTEDAIEEFLRGRYDVCKDFAIPMGVQDAPGLVFAANNSTVADVDEAEEAIVGDADEADDIDGEGRTHARPSADDVDAEVAEGSTGTAEEGGERGEVRDDAGAEEEASDGDGDGSADLDTPT